jgi:hypothetical protein
MSVTGSPPVRYTSGVSTSAVGYALADYTFRTPMRLNEFFTDFNTYNAGDWTVTASSSGTIALRDYNGGAITVTTATSAADVEGAQLKNKSFAFTTGSQVWFSINISLTTATTPALMMGLSNTFAALAPTDGVYFSKVAGSTTMNLLITAGSTSTTLAVGTMADATQYTFSFYFDGKPTPTLKVFSTIGYSTPTAFSVPYYNGGNQEVNSASSETGATNTLVNLPTPSTLLTAGFAIKSSGGTLAGIGIIDYFLASEEIVGRF